MIVRGARPADRFTIVANAALEDSRLSWRARGILAYMLGRPEGWKTSAERLMAQGTEGRDAVRSALAELESLGYLVRTKVQDSRGRWSTVLAVHDSPVEVEADSRTVGSPDNSGNVGSPDNPGSKDSGSPVVGEPVVGGPAVGSPAVGEPGPISKKEHQEGEQEPSPLPSSYTSPPPPGVAVAKGLPRLPWYPTQDKVDLAKATYPWVTEVVLRDVTARFINWITTTAERKVSLAVLTEERERYSGIWFSTFLARENRDRETAERLEREARGEKKKSWVDVAD